MKCAAFIACAAALVILGLAAADAQQGPAKSGGLPPLKIEKSAPLLLDAPASEKPGVKDSAAPKLVCYDCHGPFKEESFSVTHAQHKVLCTTCHGMSQKHADDEGSTTPPDVMFARDSINKKCGECHAGHDVPAAKVIARWQKRGLQKIETKNLVCTDCHGEHRMNVRTVLWDKRTGKVISSQTKAGSKAKD